MLFSNFKFLSLWFSQILSQFAERFFLFILVLQIYDNFGQKSFGVALLGLLFGLPAVVFGPLAGVWVDAWDKKKTLVLVNLSRSILLLLVFLLPVLRLNALYLMAIAFSVASLTQFFIPAELACIPLVTRSKKDLVLANSFFITTFYAIGVVGFAIGSATVLYLDASYFYLVGAILFGLSALILLSLPQYKVHLNLKSVKHFLTEFKVGLSYAWEDEKIRNLLYGMFLISTVFSTLTVLGIAFVDHVMQLPKEQFGYLALIGGVGMMLGIFSLNGINQKINLFKIVWVGFLGGAIAFGLFAGLRNLWVQFISLAVAGFFFAWIMIPIQTGLQLYSLETHRGRVMGLQNMVLNFALTFPVFILGWMADYWGIQFVFILLTVLLATEAIRLLFSLPSLLKVKK